MRNSISLNPFLARELRSRWRDRRSFFVVFGFVTILAFVMASYYYGVSSNSYTAEGSITLEKTGSEMFGLLAWVGTLGWLLVSPSLTASSIAYEREHGLLEHLLMAPMSPGSIARGKLGASLCFGLILLTATVPLLAMTMLFGRVSPGEFWTVTALQAGTGIFGAAVGLASSAFSYRGNMATRSAYGILVVWLITSFAASVSTNLLGAGGVTGVSLPTQQAIHLYGQTNPIMASLQIVALFPSADEWEGWQVTLAFEAIGAVLCMLLAARLLRKPLPDQQWIETKRNKGKKSRGSHFHIPLTHFLHFTNPVLNREVRGKFRMRQPPLLVIVIEVLLGLVVAYYYLYALYLAWFSPPERTLIWWVISFVGLIVLMMTTAVMGATSFARERENGNWEGVQLSLLSAQEIIAGKLGGSVVACAIFSIPFWPLLLPCLRWEFVYHPTWRENGVGLSSALASLLVYVFTAFAYTSFGMFISWRMKRTSAAVGCTLGALLASLILLPILAIIVDTSSSDFSTTVLGLTNPVAVMAMASDGGREQAFRSGIPFALCMGVFGGAMLLLLKADVEAFLSRTGAKPFNSNRA